MEFNQEIDKITDKINKLDDLRPVLLSPEFFVGRKDKSTLRVIDNSDVGVTVTIKKKGISYKFKQPCNLSQIEFKGVSSMPKLKVSYRRSGSDEFIDTEDVFNVSDKLLEVHRVGETICELFIKPDGVLNRKEEITNVKPFCYLGEDFENLYSEIRKTRGVKEQLTKLVDKEKAEIQRLRDEASDSVKRSNDELTALNAKIEERGEVLEELEEKISSHKGDKQELDEEINSLNGQLSNLTNQIDEAQSTLNDKNSLSEKVSREIASLKKQRNDFEEKLNSLQDNVALYTEDMDGITEHGNTLKKSYYIAIGVMGLIVVAASCYSVYSFYDVFNFYTSDPQKYKIDELIKGKTFSLLPLVALDIIAFTFIKSLYGRIIRINDRRLELNEVGKLARDTAKHLTVGYEKPDKNQIIREIKTNYIDDYMHSKKKNKSFLKDIVSFFRKEQKETNAASNVEDLESV